MNFSFFFILFILYCFIHKISSECLNFEDETTSAWKPPGDPQQDSGRAGESIAVSPNKYVIVGAPSDPSCIEADPDREIARNGAVYILTPNDDATEFETTQICPELNFTLYRFSRVGQAVALNSDATLAAIGAPQYDEVRGIVWRGVVFIWQRDAMGEWSELMRLPGSPGERLGTSIAPHPTEDGFFIGAPRYGTTGAIYYLQVDKNTPENSVLTRLQPAMDVEYQGASVAASLQSNGMILVSTGATNSLDAANGGTSVYWNVDMAAIADAEPMELTHPTMQGLAKVGTSISSRNSGLVVVGGPSDGPSESGAIWVHDFNSGSPVATTKVDLEELMPDQIYNGSRVRFGGALTSDLEGDMILVGAIGATLNSRLTGGVFVLCKNNITNSFEVIDVLRSFTSAGLNISTDVSNPQIGGAIALVDNLLVIGLPGFDGDGGAVAIFAGAPPPPPTLPPVVIPITTPPTTTPPITTPPTTTPPVTQTPTAAPTAAPTAPNGTVLVPSETAVAGGSADDTGLIVGVAVGVAAALVLLGIVGYVAYTRLASPPPAGPVGGGGGPEGVVHGNPAHEGPGETHENPL